MHFRIAARAASTSKSWTFKSDSAVLRNVSASHQNFKKGIRGVVLDGLLVFSGGPPRWSLGGLLVSPGDLLVACWWSPCVLNVVAVLVVGGPGVLWMVSRWSLGGLLVVVFWWSVVVCWSLLVVCPEGCWSSDPPNFSSADARRVLLQRTDPNWCVRVHQ